MIPDASYDFTAKAEAFLHGKGTYYWVFLPPKTAKAVAHMQQGRKRGGWGAVRVKATIGGTSWNSSIFPYNNSYFLLLNAKVRKAEAIADGSKLAATITLLD